MVLLLDSDADAFVDSGLLSLLDTAVVDDSVPVLLLDTAAVVDAVAVVAGYFDGISRWRLD